MSEKNKPTVLPPSSHLFNVVINSYCLREIKIIEGKYTWSNKQKNPTLEKLDRVLMSPDWECLYPMVFVKLVKDQSDHNCCCWTLVISHMQVVGENSNLTLPGLVMWTFYHKWLKFRPNW